MRALGDEIREGDVILSNHPCAGGSHLPDLTVITPVGNLVQNRGIVISDEKMRFIWDLKNLSEGLVYFLCQLCDRYSMPAKTSRYSSSPAVATTLILAAARPVPCRHILNQSLKRAPCLRPSFWWRAAYFRKKVSEVMMVFGYYIYYYSK